MNNAWKLTSHRIAAQLTWIRSLRVRPAEHQICSFVHSLASLRTIGNHERCFFSSEPTVELKDRYLVLVADIFSKPTEPNEIQAKLDFHKVQLDREMVLLALQRLEGNLDTARRFFDWVSSRENQVLRSRSYNLMLRMIGSKGDSGEFWDLVDTMKKKGFGISKETCLKIFENLPSDGNGDDFTNRLKKMYLQICDSHGARLIPKICKILKEKEDPEEIHKNLLELNICLSSDLIISVLERVGSSPYKALIFFEWCRDERSFKIDGTVYNAIAKVLGREDCIEKFWVVLHQMRNASYKMEKSMYYTVLDRFHKRKMIAEAVDLYEFAMTSPEKPGANDFLHLLKWVAVSKDLDMNLISKLVRIFLSSGSTIKESTFGSVLKSLKSVGRLGECDKILKAMEEGGFVATSSIQSQVVTGLCCVGKLDAACEYVKSLEKACSAPNPKVLASLVQNHAQSGELDKAVYFFREMVELKDCDQDDGRSAFDALVTELCKKNKNKEAFKFCREMVEIKKFRPLQCTYKFLIENFLNMGCIKEAIRLLEMMKGHKFSPFVEPFIVYMAKSGSVTDALGFLKALGAMDFPSRGTFLRIFRVLLDAGRHDVAHDILSKSPRCIRNHADVLEMFSSLKPIETALA